VALSRRDYSLGNLSSAQRRVWFKRASGRDRPSAVPVASPGRRGRPARRFGGAQEELGRTSSPRRSASSRSPTCGGRSHRGSRACKWTLEGRHEIPVDDAAGGRAARADSAWCL